MLLLFRLTNIAEMRNFVQRRHRRPPTTIDSDEEAAEQARLAEEVGSTADSTGVLPDDQRL